MTTTQGEHAQTEALRLADELLATWPNTPPLHSAAAELRRLHAQVAALTAAPAQPAAPQGVAYAELPKITAEDRSFLHDNPNTDDIVKWVQDYARACIAADRASNGQAPAGAAKVRAVCNQMKSELAVLHERFPETRPTAQAAPAAGAVAGPVETIKFSDGSTADPVEKARRYLNAMADHRINSQYFFDDGWPKKESAIDAMATLAVLEQLAAAPTPAAQADSVLEDAARPTVIPVPGGAELHFEPYVIGSPQTFWRLRRDGVHIRWLKEYEQGFVNAAIDAARKQGGKHD